MKTKIIFVGIFLIFVSNLFSQELRKNESVESYRKKISNLNLINGLYLTGAQIEKMLIILHELENTKNE